MSGKFEYVSFGLKSKCLCAFEKTLRNYKGTYISEKSTKFLCSPNQMKKTGQQTTNLLTKKTQNKKVTSPWNGT